MAMKLISATLMTAAGAAAAMLWMNKDRYLNRQFRGDATGRAGTSGGAGTGSDFLSEETISPGPSVTATH